MPRNEEEFKQALASAVSMPASAQRFLYLYWLLANKKLSRLAEESAHIQPVNRRAEDVLCWMRNAQEQIENGKNLQLVLRRVESYLGHKPREIDMKILEDSMNLIAVKWIRASILNSDSDEEIAEWLRNFLPASPKGKHGRPAGTMDCDGHALLALVLHDNNPNYWTWPKLADNLLSCKDGPHRADCECGCVDRLKHSVGRLRTFLLELGYQSTVK
jgi:hypothetical protein